MTVIEAYYAGMAVGAGTMLLVLGLLYWQEPRDTKCPYQEWAERK